METSVDTRELEEKVKDMYRHVAEEPGGEYHFELGRGLAVGLALVVQSVLPDDGLGGDRREEERPEEHGQAVVEERPAHRYLPVRGRAIASASPPAMINM